MGILRKLRQWREEPDGTLTGPAVSTEETQHTDESGDNPWRTYVDDDGALVTEYIGAE